MRLTNWRAGTCFFALEFFFPNAVAGMYLWDESGEALEGIEPDIGGFEGGRGAYDYPVWVDHSGSRLDLYGDLGRMQYQRLDSYLFVGQSIVILLDVADVEPVVRALPVEHVNGA
ncbi:hypothetical protein [Luteimonas deserti]|uniref:Uncharacterized protein n=1 Tax=Luteimonas deserti TaxID=2752306 RepID=A0A7Z0TZJ3_9GAMM|nr:hypothetical protein [Luteimonas deserti]NYZ63487.1 hypothetical protein [Luteimonas deserti]